MGDYRAMFDSDYLGAWDLLGRDVTVTISEVKGETIVGEKGRKAKKPIVYFEGKDKGLAINRTNGKTIAALYGNDVAKWKGRRITIYPTTTEMAGQTVDCIRVRPKVPPEARRGGGAEPAAPADPAPPPAAEPREPGAEG